MFDTENLLFDYEPSDIIAKDKEHLWHHLFQHRVLETQDPKVFVEGDGLRVRDLQGREYLDATSGGVWCVNIGYGRKTMASVVHDQMVRLPFYASVAGTIPAIQFADKLADCLPGLSHIFFSNSGSEANEKAFKMIRQLAHMGGTGKSTVLYRDRDYHGTTIACLAASGQAERREAYGPFPEGFAGIPSALCYRCPFNKTYPACDVACAYALEDAIQREGPETVGAIILEPITAGGGVIPPVREYYSIIKKICERHGVLLIMDEVVCGFGRTGTMFGFHHYDVVPDMVTMAKGMASSYAAISATAVRPGIFEGFLDEPSQRLNYFRDISTYGGCTGGFAAALENLRIIEEERLVENARLMGDHLLDRLRELLDFKHVGDIRGKGLFAGIELVEDKETKVPMADGVMNTVMGKIAGHGILAGRTNRSIPGLNNTINLAPALIATRADIDEIVEGVHRGIEEGCRLHFS